MASKQRKMKKSREHMEPIEEEFVSAGDGARGSSSSSLIGADEASDSRCVFFSQFSNAIGSLADRPLRRRWRRRCRAKARDGR